MEGTYPPFNYQDEKGDLVGFEVDFANALTALLGVKPDIRPTKWDGILAALESGRIDVVINQVTITPERQKRFDFSQPYTVSGIQIIVRKGDEGKISKPADLAGHAWAWVWAPTTSSGCARMCRRRTCAPMTTIPPSTRTAGRAHRRGAERPAGGGGFREEVRRPIVGAGEPFAKQLQGIALRKDPVFYRVMFLYKII